MPPKPGSPDYRYLKTADEVFGKKRGVPIETGFFFKNGVYIDAPYIVSRRGGDVFVNNIKVETVLWWPPVDWEDKNPEVPKGLTKHSTFKDLETPGRPYDQWVGKMSRWVFRHYGRDQVLKVEAENFKRLLFVKDVEIKGDELIVTTWSSDKKEHFDMAFDLAQPPAEPASTPEQSLRALDRVCSQWEGRLKKGDCLFLFGKHTEISFGKAATINLGAIVRVLRGNEPKERKIKELQKLEFLPPPPHFNKAWNCLFTNFSASSQLDERIKQLRFSAP